MEYGIHFDNDSANENILAALTEDNILENFHVSNIDLIIVFQFVVLCIKILPMLVIYI